MASSGGDFAADRGAADATGVAGPVAPESSVSQQMKDGDVSVESTGKELFLALGFSEQEAEFALLRRR